jgi:hypothetical protein
MNDDAESRHDARQQRRTGCIAINYEMRGMQEKIISDSNPAVGSGNGLYSLYVSRNSNLHWFCLSEFRVFPFFHVR